MTTDGAQIATLESLPSDLAACHALIRQLLEHLDNSSRKLTQMEHQLQQLLRRLYGRSSEKIDPKQMALFAEMLKQLEAQNPVVEPEPAPVATPAPTNRKGHGRRRIPDDLPRERRIHDLPEEEKPCPCCGTMREVIGQEVSEQLDIEPAKLKVIEHVRLKYICKECEKKAVEGGPQIVTAEKPLSPIEKGLAAPGLIAHVIVSRFCDHMPYYRQAKMLRRAGIELSRSTQSDISAQSAQALLPLYDLMVKEVLASRVIHTDDTPVDVLDPPLGKTRQGRFWVYLGDKDHPYIVFDYTPNRKRDGPMTFLKDWGKTDRRFLQADAFGGYDGIYAGEAGGNVVEWLTYEGSFSRPAEPTTGTAQPPWPTSVCSTMWRRRPTNSSGRRNTMRPFGRWPRFAWSCARSWPCRDCGSSRLGWNHSKPPAADPSCPRAPWARPSRTR